jgi:hypothetical protein
MGAGLSPARTAVTSGSSPTCRLQWPCTAASKLAPAGSTSAEIEVLARAEDARAAVLQADLHLPAQDEHPLRRPVQWNSLRKPTGLCAAAGRRWASAATARLRLALGERRWLPRGSGAAVGVGEQDDLGEPGHSRRRRGRPRVVGATRRATMSAWRAWATSKRCPGSACSSGAGGSSVASWLSAGWAACSGRCAPAMRRAQQVGRARAGARSAGRAQAARSTSR